MPGVKTSAISPSLTKTAVLALAHRQLGAELDLVVVALEAPGERVGRVVGPLDDVDELARRAFP
jgi:hypothetical protein